MPVFEFTEGLQRQDQDPSIRYHMECDKELIKLNKAATPARNTPEIGSAQLIPWYSWFHVMTQVRVDVCDLVSDPLLRMAEFGLDCMKQIHPTTAWIAIVCREAIRNCRSCSVEHFRLGGHEEGCAMDSATAVSKYGVQAYERYQGFPATTLPLETHAHAKLFRDGLSRLMRVTTDQIVAEAKRRVPPSPESVNFNEERAADLRGNFYRVPLLHMTRLETLKALVVARDPHAPCYYAKVLAKGTCRECRKELEKGESTDDTELPFPEPSAHTCQVKADKAMVKQRMRLDVAPLIVDDDLFRDFDNDEEVF